MKNDLHPYRTNLFRIGDFDDYLDEMEIETSELESLIKLKEWIIKFLCKPYKNLGRRGHVCPYTKLAIQNDNLKFSLLSVNENDFSIFEKHILEYLHEFVTSQKEKRNVYNTFVIALLNIKDVKNFVDKAHEQIKPKFVAKGYMLGQFYPGCTIPGIHNTNFLSLDSPHPMFVIRNMVENDNLFLQDNEDHMEYYNRHFKTASIKRNSS
jgi:hypothetical protein